MDADNVVIVNESLQDQKLQAMREEGLSSLHIVADFDLTLTRANVDGQRSATTWDAFDLNDDYKAEVIRLAKLYIPIEYDPHISSDIKKEKMHEWWKLHLAELIRHGLSKEKIKEVVLEGKIIPRSGLKEFCDYTYERGIPVLIFSGGVGDIITEFLIYHKLLHSNIHIISNFFAFDAQGKASGFIGEAVHASNKSEVQIKNKPYMNEIIHRKNVILLGDNPTDAKMAEGIPHNNIIKVGFLNGRHESLDAYAELYDVINTEDASVHFVTRLLKRIESK